MDLFNVRKLGRNKKNISIPRSVQWYELNYCCFLQVATYSIFENTVKFEALRAVTVQIVECYSMQRDG